MLEVTIIIYNPYLKIDQVGDTDKPYMVLCESPAHRDGPVDIILSLTTEKHALPLHVTSVLKNVIYVVVRCYTYSVSSCVVELYPHSI